MIHFSLSFSSFNMSFKFSFTNRTPFFISFTGITVSISIEYFSITILSISFVFKNFKHINFLQITCFSIKQTSINYCKQKNNLNCVDQSQFKIAHYSFWVDLSSGELEVPLSRNSIHFL